MARLRISGPAQADLVHVLETSRSRWEESGSMRYRALLVAAMQAIARSPEGLATRSRPELGKGVRSPHIRIARTRSGVKHPVHVVFYRLGKDAVEILRVLHERMEPTRHVTSPRRRARVRARK